MKQNKFALTVAVAAAILGAASTANAQSGLYTVASVGYTTIGQNVDGINLDFKEPGVNVRLGYQINKYFAVEGGYDYFGVSKYNIQFPTDTVRLNQKVTGLSFGVVGRYPVHPQIALRGQLGYLQAKGDNTFSSANTGESETVSAKEKKLYLGVGFEYLITKKLSMVSDLRFARLGESGDGSASNLVSTNVGLKMNF